MTSPEMASPWGSTQHQVDRNGYINGSSSGQIGVDTSFDSSHSRQRRGSSPGKRALNWFTRSRSASPQNGEQSPSSTSFVVRNVIKQPGGVSQGQYDDEYHQMKSQPLAASLGVPPGGPGGGVGYGTAKSSNDGRPEGQRQERGRSISPTRPSRPPSPGAITAGAFRSGRVSPGPQSWTQARTKEEEMKSHSPHRIIQQGISPAGPRSSPFSQQQQKQQQHHQQHQQHLGGVLSSSPLAGSILPLSPSTSSINANEQSSHFSMPVRFRPSSGPPPIIPLEGIPSPIDIPTTPAQAGVTPLGSVSPAGSPGYFQNSREYSAKTGPASPNLASRLMKGLFGKSPVLDGGVEMMCSSSGSEAQWMRKEMSSSDPHSSKHLHNAWTDGSPLAGYANRDEQEAEERKKQSMQMATRIEDRHRDELMMRIPREDVSREWSPSQVIRADNGDQGWDPPQSKSPPGRKPVPRYSVQELQDMSQEEREIVASRVDPDDRLRRLEGRLTPAQQIIADTRSKQNARERSQGGGKSNSTQVQIGFKIEEEGAFDPGKTSDSPLLQREKEDLDLPVRRNSKRASPGKVAIANATLPSQPVSNGYASIIRARNVKDMPIGDVLQDMMVRFHRFERYAVPLMRSMEARIIDVERDNQMALHGDTMSANSGRDREMDKWVGQMTELMKHEIGQLKVATRELREGREILAQYVHRRDNASHSSTFVSHQVNDQKNRRNSPSSTQVELGKSIDVEEKDTVAEMEVREVGHSRKTNISSSSFNSAVPRKLALNIPGKAINQEVTREASTASSSSPNGRMRYTSALGKPMQDGRISPAVSPSKERETTFIAPSPTPSNQSGTRRMQSLDDRLKALVVDKLRSPSITSASTQASSQSVHGEGFEEEADESDNTSFEKIPSHKIGDNYQVVRMKRGQSEASARSAKSVESVRKMIDSGHLQTPSTSSNKNDSTIRKSAHQSSRSSSDGIETSYRQQSSSPTPVTTSILASNELRARAQSYLLIADGSNSNPSSTPSSPGRSPQIMDSPPRFVKALQVQSDLLGSNAPTLKANNNTCNSSNTPVRPSIRDRVAFFDAAR